MCFSATGSFAASATLLVLGAASAVRDKPRAARLLALTPLLFAAQQLAEGIVWLTLAGSEDGLLHAMGLNLFLAVALVIWPLWVPVSLVSMETADARRRRLLPFVVAGATVAAIGTAVIVHLRPHAELAGHSIHYSYGLAGGTPLHVAYLLLYMVATVVPFFRSSLPLAKGIGVVLLVALGATLAIKHRALTSVWCFFAAVISLLVIVSVSRVNEASRSRASVG
jgi:hypothetical protein